MTIAFWKMHGAGNDFILVDDRRTEFPASDAGWIRRLCARNTGVGSEGVILIWPSTVAHFQMRFLNPDGSVGEMCGNGARCVARLAYDQGIAPPQMLIETGAGLVRAEIVDDLVRLFMTPPVAWRMSFPLEVCGWTGTCHSVNTGVPHAVIEMDALASVNIHELGRAIRYHPAFAPRGTNVNFMTVTGPGALRLRTYERGVEAETPACGTGSVACALVAGRLGKVTPPVQVACAHGDILVVDFRLKDDGAEDVTLIGPAVYIFEGQIKYRS
ncbi:MAG: diaminopimelate epimerase [Verrucomicrobia bacterium]|nr:diaminopimelate epimerase [Verrucomicrobiota bacterium]MBU4290311.1 diaminopimelate epimerase [Verrucomicrobiota bacterium]MBU4428025.1 diaminopimelate epimerase [Verrucomicrobiota bacterium]MCG2679521.1 diaminopimelate epimerase [Kiritimatiellia bacterium]